MPTTSAIIGRYTGAFRHIAVMPATAVVKVNGTVIAESPLYEMIENDVYVSFRCCRWFAWFC